MRAHYLQHVPFEGLGSIESWLKANDYEISSTKFYESTLLPNPDEVDLLIIMGGPMSVHDEVEFPWLVDEKQFIRAMIKQEKPVLGVCLGAQLIAHALGARVYNNPVKEIGWFPVQGVAANKDRYFQFPEMIDVFHWHGETFDLPRGGIHLAGSAACKRQAFQYGASVIALQFHLETTPRTARQLIEQCRAELVPAKYVQDEASLKRTPPQSYLTINNLMDRVLTFLTVRPSPDDE
jgi:GMP synthase-like glutamine amidotransferase